jgi:hypothetical protein
MSKEQSTSFHLRSDFYRSHGEQLGPWAAAAAAGAIAPIFSIRDMPASRATSAALQFFLNQKVVFKKLFIYSKYFFSRRGGVRNARQLKVISGHAFRSS